MRRAAVCCLVLLTSSFARGDSPEGSFGDGAAKAPTKNGGPKRAESWLLVDEAFGVRLKGMGKWRMAIADDEYQLERTDEQPNAVLAIRRVPFKNAKAYEKTATAGGGRSRKTRFAGADALLVEQKSGDTVERSYHVLRAGYALVFEFRIVGRAGDDGVEARVFEVEQSLTLDDKGLGAWSDGATELTTYGGVRMATTAGWKLAAIGPARANFRSPGGVEVEVRVRPWPAASDPYVLVEDEVKAACGKDPYTRADAAVLGARAAVRFRCAAKQGARVVLVADGVTADGAKIYVQVTAQNPKKKGEPADGDSAEFGAYLTLPR